MKSTLQITMLFSLLAFGSLFPVHLSAQTEVVEVVNDSLSKDFGGVYTHPTRYLFAPSAIPLRRGEGYYHNYMLGLNSVSVGITDNVSLTGGVDLLILLLSSTFNVPLLAGYANLKYGHKVSERVHVGGGLMAAGLIFLRNFDPDFMDLSGLYMTIGYGMVTYGNENSHATAAIGLGNVRGEWANSPVIVLSGAHRLNRRIGLITENWIFANVRGGALGTSSGNVIGVRLMSDLISLDLGLATSISASTENLDFSATVPLPIIGASVKW